jgi:hypothetical protein
MRPGFPTLVVVAALAAPGAGVAQAPAVTVSVSPSAPTAPAGSRSPSGRRTYSVSFRVRVASDQECQNLSVTYTYKARFDGRPSLAGSAADSYETNKPASSASFAVRASAGAADEVAFTARAACEDEEGSVLGSSAPTVAKVTVPAHSCAEGPLRVLDSKGASRQDLVSPRRRVPVRAGHYLWTGYRVWVARRGRISYGAPECHGLRAIVRGPARFVPGDYARRSYGAPTELGFGEVVDFRGDQHSGGVATNIAVALPRGARTGPSAVARFEIKSASGKLGRMTRVRVRSGRVYVAGRIGRGGYGAPLIARPGQTVVVRCSGRTCRPKLA